MPVRLVCPSCSATLSVKDEYAGRAVKCPKCGGVIPASQPGAAPPPAAASPPAPPPPPPPPPEPEFAAPAFDALDQPAAPKPKITGRPTGKPVAKAGSDDPPEDDDKPARRKGRDDERGAKKDRDGDEDDRPARGKKKRGDGDDEDDRPVKKGSNALLIIAVICGTLLLCCGGTGFAVYYYIIKPVKETVQKGIEEVKTWNFLVNQSSYNDLDVGETTRTQANAKLGEGRIATDADLQKVFANDPGRINDWNAKVSAKRAVVWQNSEDYVIAAFSPTAEGDSRLQMKEWRPKSGAALKEGELDDAKFATTYPPGGGTGMPVTVTELSEAYKAGNGTVGDPKYKGKWLLVEGKIKDIDFNYATPADVRIGFEGVKKDGGGTMDVHVALTKADAKKGLALSPGQTVRLKCKCKGYTFGSLDLENGTVSGTDPDPNPTVTAAALAAEYTKDNEATDDKYSTKFLTVTDATVESVNGDTLVLTSGPKKGTGAKIHVSLSNDQNFKKAAGTIAVNKRVTVKGTYSRMGGSPNVNLSYAWVVPK